VCDAKKNEEQTSAARMEASDKSLAIAASASFSACDSRDMAAAFNSAWDAASSAY